MRLRAEAALLSLTVVWGATFLAIQFALNFAEPLFYVGLRFAIASAVALAIAGASLRQITRGEIIAGCAIGTAIFSGHALQAEGLKYVLSSESAFITALYVPIVPLLQWAVMKRNPRLTTWAGIGLAFAGMVLIGSRGAGIQELGRGELLTLVSAFVFAGEILLIGYFAPNVDARRVTAIQLMVTAFLAFASMPMFGESLPATIPWQLWAVAGALGVASTGIQLTMNWAQKIVSPARATIIYATEPVWAGVIGLAAGERLGMYGWIGGALVIAGVLVSEIRRGKAD